MSTFREELEKLGSKELNDVEQRIVNEVKNQIKEYVKENGLHGQFRGEVRIEDIEISKVRSNVINRYMQLEGLPTFVGGMMTNMINRSLDALLFGTTSFDPVVYFSYKVQF